MTRHKVLSGQPIKSPGRCGDCGKMTLEYLGDPLAATGLWKCSGCKWRQIGVRPAFDPVPDHPDPVQVAIQKAAPAPRPYPEFKWRKEMASAPVSFENIMLIVGDELRVTRAEIESDQRHKVIVLARELVIALCRELNRLSYPSINQAMGGRNHSTTITAYKRFMGELGRPLDDRLRSADEGRGMPPATKMLGLTDATVGDLFLRLRERLVVRETEQASGGVMA